MSPEYVPGGSFPGLAVTTAADGAVTVTEPPDGFTESQFPPLIVDASSVNESLPDPLFRTSKSSDAPGSLAMKSKLKDSGSVANAGEFAGATENLTFTWRTFGMASGAWTITVPS